MDQVNVRRDGLVLWLLALAGVLLVAALAGAYRVFGYTLVLFLGTISGLGFVRRGAGITWVPPLLATAVLLISFTGMFAFESAPVNAATDTWLGFQKGTAFLVWGVWIPAFFTLGVGFTLVFDHLSEHPQPARGGRQ